MESNYRPQSPDLSSYAPQSPDLSGFQPQSPDLSALGPSPFAGNFGQPAPAYPQGSFGQPAPAAAAAPGGRFQGAFACNNGYGIPHGQHPHHHQQQLHHQPTSVPQLPPAAYQQQQQQQQYHHQQPPQYHHQQPHPQPHSFYPGGMPAQPSGGIKLEPHHDAEWLPDAQQTPAKRPRRGLKQEPQQQQQGFYSGYPAQQGSFGAPIKSEPLPDPTLGCQLRTSFPVARIKRLMQADEDIGKVAQVTPTVVSRALELFMIKIISASADQARGGASISGGGAGGGGGPGAAAAASKGPKRILVQHLKKAVLADETFDFLSEIVGKVPDAPAKGKKEAGSDSEDGGSGGKPKKRGKRRKDSTDDF